MRAASRAGRGGLAIGAVPRAVGPAQCRIGDLVLERVVGVKRVRGHAEQLDDSSSIEAAGAQLLGLLGQPNAAERPDRAGVPRTADVE